MTTIVPGYFGFYGKQGGEGLAEHTILYQRDTTEISGGCTRGYINACFHRPPSSFRACNFSFLGRPSVSLRYPPGIARYPMVSRSIFDFRPESHFILSWVYFGIPRPILVFSLRVQAGIYRGSTDSLQACSLSFLVDALALSLSVKLCYVFASSVFLWAGLYLKVFVISIPRANF